MKHKKSTQSVSWGDAARATSHCLTGCAVGEVAGMVIGALCGLTNGQTIFLSVGLAFIFGYGLTMWPLLRSGLVLRSALAVALAADTISIAVMEVIDNVVIVAVPGALAAGLTDMLFWGTLTASLAAAFVVATPVNRALIARGRGHALVHEHH